LIEIAKAARTALTGSDCEKVEIVASFVPSETTLKSGRPLPLVARKVSLSEENQEPDDC